MGNPSRSESKVIVGVWPDGASVDAKGMMWTSKISKKIGRLFFVIDRNSPLLQEQSEYVLFFSLLQCSDPQG
jgi:hypothetical protein